MIFDLYVTCDRCEGTGYRQLAGPLHITCRACRGTGQRKRTLARLLALLRYGTGSDY